MYTSLMRGVGTKWFMYVLPLTLLTDRIYQSPMDILVYILSLPIGMKYSATMVPILLTFILFLVGYKVRGIPPPEKYGL